MSIALAMSIVYILIVIFIRIFHNRKIAGEIMLALIAFSNFFLGIHLLLYK